MTRHATGPANWKERVAPLSDEDASRRWQWMHPWAKESFEALAESDLDAYLDLDNLIEAATKGLLNPEDTSIALVNHPLGRRRTKWPRQAVPWIAEWKQDATTDDGCYRLYFTDALGAHDGVDFQMLGILLCRYPDKSLKEAAQTKDIETSMDLAMRHQREHGCTLRTFPS